ncbi:MAG: TetR/AcrR family transcriptional regulator [Sedimentitalea sp.]|uniref:TetR/AcrR family transcriptional regulator n=1 Tax=Sedimentitalea sp. TaxID=2048915 RepID=UPI003267B08E
MADKTRLQLLKAAQETFAEFGLKGARIDTIAQRAGVNKQLVYHYFGNKDGLYSTVLEKVYSEIRERESELKLSTLPVEEAMRSLIEFSYDYLRENPDFVRILADENVHGGRHMQASETVQALNTPIITLIEETLVRGVDEGLFRKGVDPLHFYLSIAGMSFFYFANIHTISRAFGRDFDTKDAMDERRAHIVDLALNGIRPRPVI